MPEFSKEELVMVEAMIGLAIEEIVSVAVRYGSAIKNTLDKKLDEETKSQLIKIATDKFTERISRAIDGKISAKELGDRIKRAIVEGGSVKGLYVMLRDAFGERK